MKIFAAMIASLKSKAERTVALARFHAQRGQRRRGPMGSGAIMRGSLLQSSVIVKAQL
jgi:hypothetical protein